MLLAILRQHVQRLVVAGHSVGIEASQRGDARRKVDGRQHSVAACCKGLKLECAHTDKAPKLSCHAFAGRSTDNKIAQHKTGAGALADTLARRSLRMNGGCLLVCTQAAPPGVSPSAVVPLSVLSDTELGTQPPVQRRAALLLSLRLPYACLCSVAAE
jgi:hypothetical protein